MPNYLFSIATPTFNSLSKLKRAIGSVRNQSVRLEHIIQDGLSNDGTREWLEGQANLNWLSEKDSGMYDAINKAWHRASGDIYSWLNADEQYLPGALEIVARYFENNPKIDVVFGNYVVALPNGEIVALRKEIPFRKAYVANGFLNMQSATIFYRRNLYERGLLKLDSSYRYAADKDLILRLSDNGVAFSHIPEYLSIFGVDGTNLSTHSKMEDEIEIIRQRNGAFKSQFLRRLVMSGRYCERLLSGAYWPASIEIDYVVDENSKSIRIKSGLTSGRYSLDDFK